MCFASIAFGYPQTHFWGVPQTPSLLLCDDSDADDANDAVLGISLYHIPDSASLASSEFCLFRSMRLFLRSTLETDCWCGGMNCWAGWSSKRSIKPKTRTRRLSGLMNSFLQVPVVVFVSRKETMHRERHIQKSPAPWAQRGQHPSAHRRAVGGAAICRNRLQDRQAPAYIHLL